MNSMSIYSSHYSAQGKDHIIFFMLYLHRGMIRAAITGEEMPKAPESCPAYDPEDDDR